jgi:uroporphyrinogen III methyltransferase/synthase
MSGICYLVGAGPGDLGLVTLRAKELIETADVILHDQLVNIEMLKWARKDVEVLDVGKSCSCHKMKQEQINQTLIDLVQSGKKVVRLKGGDPLLFARGGEEMMALVRAGCEFEIVPGITAATGVAASVNMPLTHRQCASSITLITGHEDPTKSGSGINWAAVAALGGTLAIYMGTRRIEEIMATLMEFGMPADRPAAIVQSGTTPHEKSLWSTVGTIAGKAKDADIATPSMIYIGDVIAFSEEARSSETFAHPLLSHVQVMECCEI